MRKLNAGGASVSMTRVLSFGAVLCFAAPISSVGVPFASAQGPCIWRDAFWDCPGSHTPAPPDKWTAIAVSSSTLYSGSSNGQNSQDAAESLALSSCRTKALDCKVDRWGVNTCLALATSRSDHAWTTGYDTNRYRAQLNALAICRKNHGQTCVVQAAECANDDPRFPPPKPALLPGPGDDPIMGCYQWFNGGGVVIRPDHTVVGGPFTASWQLLDAAQRTYLLTWQQPGVSRVTISADQRSLAGGNQYGGKDTATRLTGTSGLVGTWHWVDVVASTVTVNSDGTFSAVSSNATWHGKWESIKASPGTYTLTASDLPKDKVTLAGDGSRLSGADQYGLTISGVRRDSCP